ncbi:hypothetical protein [Halorubrum distributum]|uniref:Uncharacterized protein n=1 Tax=Halorubrum distributum JCM 13916 TaxID=1230455 RepID=M0PQJ7_9EURY|nr:hypothetical protein [Halorubrum arcis]EMA71809.1 hypothetical protein C462_04984 [Halorubrum arcis JCM 13916]
MDSSTSSAAGARASRRWSLFAGVYAFACAALTAASLSTVLGLFGEVIGLPTALVVPILAAPALFAGALVWWALVERRGTVTYLRGGAFGLLTALVTGTLWTARFVSVWSPEMLAADPVRLLVGFVFAAVSVAGVVVGLPITYVRRRSRGASDGPGTANSL